jgi:hypothetical protein
MNRFRPRMTYANVVSTLCLFLLLGGASYAAVHFPKNSVGSKQLKKNAVTTVKIRNEAVTAEKVKKGTLTGAQINASTLGTVPNADHATSATSAASATSATSAKNATNAKNATDAANADNASKLGGVVPVPPATPITLLNDWQPYGAGYDQPAYWQDANGVVHLKGSVAQPVAGSDIIFVLPAGLRPARSTNWPATLDSAHFGTIEIEADGSVRSRTFNATQAGQAQLFTSMEGVSFRPSDP